ncbi:MAG: hypothetical protein ACRDUA_00065 [Micromonosporaceae bacterium]
MSLATPIGRYVVEGIAGAVARTSLLTGRFPSAHRVRQNSAIHEVVRGDDLIDVLRRAGYSLHFDRRPDGTTQPLGRPDASPDPGEADRTVAVVADPAHRRSAAGPLHPTAAEHHRYAPHLTSTGTPAPVAHPLEASHAAPLGTTPVSVEQAAGQVAAAYRCDGRLRLTRPVGSGSRRGLGGAH